MEPGATLNSALIRPSNISFRRCFPFLNFYFITLFYHSLPTFPLKTKALDNKSGFASHVYVGSRQGLLLVTFQRGKKNTGMR